MHLNEIYKLSENIYSFVFSGHIGGLETSMILRILYKKLCFETNTYI